MPTMRSRTNLDRIRAIRRELGDNDAETLARLFTDPQLADDGTIAGRVEAILEATEHQWLQGFPTFMDVPGLYELRGASDQGFRAAFRDPWPQSRDQVGHLLTAVGLILHPEVLQRRRLGRRLRTWLGVPKAMSDSDAALRLIIGHEKQPDPFFADPRIVAKVRRQFSSVTAEDLAAFGRAMAALGDGACPDLEAAFRELASIGVGTGRGNSAQDLRLSLMGAHLAGRLKGGAFASRGELAEWVRRNLGERGTPGPG